MKPLPQHSYLEMYRHMRRAAARAHAADLFLRFNHASQIILT